MNDNHRSYIHNFYNWNKKAWKKFRLGIAEVKGSNPVPAWFFFVSRNFCSCEKKAYITAMIILHLILHSAVHIYDFHIFKTLLKKKTLMHFISSTNN